VGTTNKNYNNYKNNNNNSKSKSKNNNETKTKVCASAIKIVNARVYKSGRSEEETTQKIKWLGFLEKNMPPKCGRSSVKLEAKVFE